MVGVVGVVMTGVGVVKVGPTDAEWPRMAARRHLAAGRIGTARSSRMLNEQDGF